jgi:ABC-type Fe3+-siderophore transport system permease subunit
MALKIGCCGLVMGALVYLIGHNGYSIVRLSITVVGGAVIYAATLFVARIVTPDELRKIIAQRPVVK